MFLLETQKLFIFPFLMFLFSSQIYLFFPVAEPISLQLILSFIRSVLQGGPGLLIIMLPVRNLSLDQSLGLGLCYFALVY